MAHGVRCVVARAPSRVRVGVPVTAVDALGVTIGTEHVETRTVIWAAGVAASPAGQWIGAMRDRVGRIVVDAHLSVPDHPELFAIGDTALSPDASGKPLPGVAPVAKQQGRYVGRLIMARLRDSKRIEPFRYRDYGNLATIGRKAAVIDFGWIHLSGFVAWLIWTMAHIYFLIGFRNRIIVALNWLWGLFHVSTRRTAYYWPTSLRFHRSGRGVNPSCALARLLAAPVRPVKFARNWTRFHP